MFCDERHGINVSSHYGLHYSFTTIYFTRTIIKLHIFPIIRWNIEYSLLCTKQTHIGFYNFDRYYFYFYFYIMPLYFPLCITFAQNAKNCPSVKLLSLSSFWLLQVKRNFFNHLFPLTKEAISYKEDSQTGSKEIIMVKMSKSPHLNHIEMRASVGMLQPTAMGLHGAL